MVSNLADILDETPRRRVEFDLSRVDIGNLTLMELLDASEAAGIPLEDFRENMFAESKQAALFYSIAWVILRRIEKSLTYDEVCEFDLIITGAIDEAVAEANANRAKAVVAVAALSGVPVAPVVGQMTMAEVAATVDLAEARKKAALRASRRKR